MTTYDFPGEVRTTQRRHGRIQKVFSEGEQLFFPPIIGPPAKRHLNGVSLAHCNIKWWLGSFVIFQEIRTSIAKKPYIFVIFQGGGGSGPRPSSEFAHGRLKRK